jgi:hypothetical protein
MPLEDQFVEESQPAPPTSPAPPNVPPKDFHYSNQTPQRNGELPPRPTWEPTPPRTSQATSVTSSQMSHLTAVERSRILRVARMNPHLQFMAGPLLRYDTVDENGVWYGAALIVSAYLYSPVLLYSGSINVLLTAADSGSIYEPHPTLKYGWDPDPPPQDQGYQTVQKPPIDSSTHAFELGSHPADPDSALIPVATNGAQGNGRPNLGPNAQSRAALGQEIWVYAGHGGCVYIRYNLTLLFDPFAIEVLSRFGGS